MKILVIGGGAAGMMAAVWAAQQGAQVILTEQNPKLGKKVYITGKGRCNLTNGCPTEEFFDHVVSNSKFLYSAVYAFDAAQTCRFFETEGLPLKEERGQRIFPVSDKSSDVIKTLERALQRRHVQIRLMTRIERLLIKPAGGADSSEESKKERQICVGAVTSKGEKILADAVILATGGLSYPSTGSTGDGLRFAEKLGHRIKTTEPSLVPLVTREPYVKDLEGLSLRNIEIRMGKYQDFGEMLFTADGVSGPVILSASAFLCRQIADSREGIPLTINLKPALMEQQLDERLLRDFSEAKNKDFRNALGKLLPAKMIPVMVSLSSIPETKKVNAITREERKELVDLIRNFPLTVMGTKGFSQAVITQGGVQVKDINPSTMESRKVKHLYFAGEMMDVDAYTGGFNLQIAWSTGYLAGISAAEACGDVD